MSGIRHRAVEEHKRSILVEFTITDHSATKVKHSKVAFTMTNCSQSFKYSPGESIREGKNIRKKRNISVTKLPG